MDNVTDLFYNTTGNSSLKPGDIIRKGKWFMASIIIAWSLALLMIILNSAVIVCIYRCKKRSRLNFLLLNMAIADLLTAVSDTVIHGIERTNGYMSADRGDHTDYMLILIKDSALCTLQRGLSNACCLASNYILCAASLDRALVVAKPMLSFRRGFVLQKVMIVICWVLALCGSIPLFMHYKTGTRKEYDETICLGPTDQESFKQMMYYLCFVMFVLPFLVITVSYVILVCAMYRRASSSMPHNRADGRKMSAIPQVFNNGLPRSKIRSIKLMCGIVTSFLLSWLPFYIVSLVNADGHLSDPSLAVLMMLYYCNGVANPILFFIFHRGIGSPSSGTTQSTSPHRLSFNERNDDTIAQRRLLMVPTIYHHNGDNGVVTNTELTYK